MSLKIDETRLKKVMAAPLFSGGHTPNSKMCVMEAAAYIAGESWTDAPYCVCPAIRSFMVSWNDSLPTDEDRDRLLKPLLLKVVNTRSTEEIEEQRGYMALDWLIRVHTSKFLELSDDLKFHAKTLRELEEITNLSGAMAAGTKVRAAGAAARAAARGAAGAAAAGAAARGAAGAAARGAAAGAAARGAARGAAGAAARGAARGAAGAAAAGAAARQHLQPTVEWLQKSASELVIRMCEQVTNVTTK